MKYDILQITAMVLVAIAGQSAVRLLVDHGDTGLLGRLGGGFPVLLTGYLAVAAAAGVLLAGWSHTRAKALGPPECYRGRVRAGARAASSPVGT
ncbi:hypothetical protein, partial [Streptomyces sp. NPDC059122]|uniref:hypothetical protein n=1 Tax=Streptomyces sp. NPDC059122 TaxID=3346732 RepID=UPI0036AD417E